MSKTGQYCDNCFYGANKAQATGTMIKWNDFSEKRIREQQEAKLKDVTYKDYQELTEEQTELDKLKQRIIDLQQEIPPEFEETFKKRFKDILA